MRLLADISTLRSMKKQILHDVLSTMRNANDVYFDAENKDEHDYAASTLNICKNLLNDMNF